MKYWIKVILEESVSCESCGCVVDYGDVAFVYKDDLWKDKRVRCSPCMRKCFPQRVNPGALAGSL